MAEKSLHSICRWTFNPGKGGFVPGDMRPEWGGKFVRPEMIELVAKKIRPRMSENVDLGLEVHYDAEVDCSTAAAVGEALVANKIHLAMVTPGAHAHFAHGGAVSLDPNERKAAEDRGTRTGDLACGKSGDDGHKAASAPEPVNSDRNFIRKAIFLLQLGGLVIGVIGALSGDLSITSAGLGAIGAGVYWAAKGSPPTVTASS